MVRVILFHFIILNTVVSILFKFCSSSVGIVTAGLNVLDLLSDCNIVPHYSDKYNYFSCYEGFYWLIQLQ